MTDLRTFWFHPETPLGYHKQITQLSSGAIDEKIIAELVENYQPNKEKVIVDLGIGTGRELAWLDKLADIEMIVGVDYSPVMLQFCAEEIKKYQKEIALVKDDLLNLKILPHLIKTEKRSVIYLSLVNTFGNFTKQERLVALKNIAQIMKKTDRIILALYKFLQKAKLAQFIKLHAKFLEPQNKEDLNIIAELVEYGSLPFFWTSVMKKYQTLPRFWYDKENNDVVVHIDGKRLFISHRFTKEEIEEEFAKAGLKVEKILEGKAMYIAIGKI